MDLHDYKIEKISNAFEDELEKVGFKLPGIGKILRGGLKKAPLVAAIGAGTAGAGAVGYEMGEEAGEAKIPAAFSVGVEVGAQAQAEHDAQVINALQAQLSHSQDAGQ
jgi:hypothetical protein